MGIEGTVDLAIRSQPGSKAQGDGQGVEDPEDVVDLAIKLTELASRTYKLSVSSIRILTGNMPFNWKTSSTRESGYIQAATRTDGLLSVPCRRLESLDLVD
ncbi:hypothetical protein F52700_9253 [Fusarium sp. NRRL 52700]|nr:hypothetical protein F52700_9253 [Fusarium sp. NRRL 52700]